MRELLSRVLDDQPRKLSLVGAPRRLTLSTRWRVRWEVVTGFRVPVVKTVADLQAYVDACKAALARTASTAVLRSDFEEFDIWFEMCTGESIQASPHDAPPRIEVHVEQHGPLAVHRGGRQSLEEELVRLLVLDGDPARIDEICAVLKKRADDLRVVRDGDP